MRDEIHPVRNRVVSALAVRKFTREGLFDRNRNFLVQVIRAGYFSRNHCSLFSIRIVQRNFGLENAL